MAEEINVHAKGRTGVVTGISVYGRQEEDATDGPRRISAGKVSVTSDGPAHLVTGCAHYGRGAQLETTDNKTTVSVPDNPIASMNRMGPEGTSNWPNPFEERSDVDMESILSSASHRTELSSSSWEQETINDPPHDETDPNNCWLCSIGGYYKIRVSQLMQLTEKRGQADIDEILQVYEENGVKAERKSFFDWNSVTNYLDARLLPQAKLKVVFGFRVAGESLGHMTVLKALKTRNGLMLYRIIDFQKSPNEPGRMTQNTLPTNAVAPFIIIATNHDVYDSLLEKIASKAP